MCDVCYCDVHVFRMKILCLRVRLYTSFLIVIWAFYARFMEFQLSICQHNLLICWLNNEWLKMKRTQKEITKFNQFQCLSRFPFSRNNSFFQCRNVFDSIDRSYCIRSKNAWKHINKCIALAHGVVRYDTNGPNIESVLKRCGLCWQRFTALH